MTTASITHPLVVADGGPRAAAADFNAAHKLPDGMGLDGYALTYLDASPTNVDLTNDGMKWVNVPLRASLIAPSTVLGSHTTVTAYNKQLSSVIAANTLVIGAVIRLRASMIWSAVGAPNLTLGLWFSDGTRVMGVTLTQAVTAQTDRGAWLECSWTVATLGAPGTMLAEPPRVSLQTALDLSLANPAASHGTALLAQMNTTTAWTAYAEVGWSVNSASNNSQLRTLTLEVMRPGTTVS